MKITLLCENTSSYEGAKICSSEWGFSVFIQVGDINLLFDTGHTDIYKKNAKALNINLDSADFVILSHYHWDHSDGLRFHEFKSKKKLITHSAVFDKLPKDESKKIKEDFEITTSKEPLELSKGIFYLGEIPRENNFEDGGFEGDKMLDDSAIVIKTKKGAPKYLLPMHCVDFPVMARLHMNFGCKKYSTGDVIEIITD